MRRYFYFDIDGVLVDSRSTVRAAYETALGQRIDDVTWDRYWNRPWREWLPDYVGEVGEAVSVHRRKNDSYRELVEHGNLDWLPGASVARRLLTRDEPVRFVTGASETAAHIVLKAINLPIELLDTTEMSRRDKVTRLYHLEHRGGVIHVDDDPWVVEELERRSVPVIHYSGQSEADLLDELWTRSS